jgi:tetratricopeptide (TPR) repeat protein
MPQNWVAYYCRRTKPSLNVFLRSPCLLLLALLCCSLSTTPALSAELAECRKMLNSGKYVECIAATHEAIEGRRYGESWPLIKAEAEMRIGQFDGALISIEKGFKRYSWSVRLAWLGRKIALRAGDLPLAQKRLDEIIDLNKRFPWRYTDAAELVALGELELFQGKDVRDVLDDRFEKARQRSSAAREPILAIGELALSKNDDAYAAEIFSKAIQLDPDDADFHFGLARALSDPAEAAIHLQATLDNNPQHIPARLYQIDRLVSSENYDEANKQIDNVLKINRFEPEAWAYKAVIAHFTNDPRGEAAFRAQALARWSSNAKIDHLIGRKLSQHYRFKEGSTYQQQALALNPKYAAAQRQLASDLLRLGQDESGWKLVDSAHQSDSYSVATFNLLNLKSELDKFVVLQDESFLVRMDRREAFLYGKETLALLNDAKTTLTKKYGMKIDGKIIVEIFPNQDDFAVRTFEMPAVAGYLGVCFGRVITANSPASRRENPSNWKAVLWHEFCHVVTLEMTHNRIPRWLSEGISVYEELQANKRWGQHMGPRYRNHILEGGSTPIAKLSGAFMNAKSGWHVQFAYFQSAMVVDFIVKTHGIEVLREILSDLAVGLPINVALDRRCGGLGALEVEFGKFAAKQADELGNQADWAIPEKTDVQIRNNDALVAWVKQHPTNIAGLTTLADQLLRNDDWKQAETILKRIIALYPNDGSGSSALIKLAKVYRELNNKNAERQTLESFAAINLSSVAVNLRLVQLQQTDSDWKSLRETAERLLAIDPLLPQAHSALADASEKLDANQTAILAHQRALVLDPSDPAQSNYRLARLLHQEGQLAAAKRHILMALEDAPRFRLAHQLLLKIVRAESGGAESRAR